MNLVTYSQNRQLNSNGDTVICFSTKQAKFLLKQNYKVKELKEYNNVCNQQLLYCDSLVASKDSTISTMKAHINNNKNIDSLRVKEISYLKSGIKKQKRIKTILYCSNLLTIIILILK